jgi:hypothetical protein
MWGAATHDRATGMHKPILATLLWLEPEEGDEGRSLCIVSLDHCILDGPDIELMERSIADAVAIRPGQTLITLSHTHAAGLMSRSRADPRRRLIGPYLNASRRASGDWRSKRWITDSGRRSFMVKAAATWRHIGIVSMSKRTNSCAVSIRMAQPTTRCS